MGSNGTLFVLETLGYGGPSTSLISLLELMKKKYNTVYDVLLFHKNGVFSLKYNDAFKVLETNPVLEFLSVNKKKLVKEKPLSTLLLSGVYIILKTVLGRRKAKDIFYRIAARKYKSYNTIIAYQESEVSLFCRHLKAEKKVSWLHTDINKVDIPFELNRQMYESYNQIVCVSEMTKSQFISLFPENENKAVTIHNLFRKDILLEKSKAYQVERPHSDYIFLSVGRIVEAKRFDKVIEVSKLLISQNVNFTWFILGDGHLKDTLIERTEKEGFEKNILFMGSKENPFPYYLISDYMVMTSDYEGYPMVANEAIMLGLPVITTNFSSASETVSNGINGLISCSLESKDLFKTILDGINNENIYKQLHDGAKIDTSKTDLDLKKARKIIEG